MSRATVTAFIALGANLGNAAQALSQAAASLGQLPLTQVLRCSSVYQTRAIGTLGSFPLAPNVAPGAPQEASPDYLNAVLALQTGLTAPDLLAHLQKIELAAGRERPYRNAPRTLDLDLLLYGDARIDSATLTVPHPRMNERAFVLVPLAEIAPELVSSALLQAVSDQVIQRLGAVQL